MSENPESAGRGQPRAEGTEPPNQNPPVEVSSSGVSRRNTDLNVRTRPGRRDTRPNNTVSSVQKDFEGATPSIGGILALRSENVTMKVNFDKFCEKLETYIMKEFKGGEYVVDVLKEPGKDIIEAYKKTSKPADLTTEEKKSDVEVEIKKEEIKEYVKQVHTIKSNLKKIYSLIFGNCTEGVQTMIKTDSDYETKSKAFDCTWILKKVKTITSGLDTKVNLRVSMHTALLNFMLLRQFSDESNDAYLIRFKSMVETLKIAGGEHVLVSPTLMGKTIDAATDEEIKDEKDHFLAITYVVRSDEGRYKTLLDDLKSSANRGRDEYPKSLTDAFDLLVRTSGEYDTVRRYSRNTRGRGNRGGRGRDSFLFAQTGRGNQNRDFTYSRMNTNDSTEVVPGIDGTSFEEIGCFGCGFKGHYRNQCPYV